MRTAIEAINLLALMLAMFAACATLQQVIYLGQFMGLQRSAVLTVSLGFGTVALIPVYTVALCALASVAIAAVTRDHQLTGD